VTYLDERGLWLVVASGVVLPLGDLVRRYRGDIGEI